VCCLPVVRHGLAAGTMNSAVLGNTMPIRLSGLPPNAGRVTSRVPEEAAASSVRWTPFFLIGPRRPGIAAM
jgi:hypothetical protein